MESHHNHPLAREIRGRRQTGSPEGADYDVLREASPARRETSPSAERLPEPGDVSSRPFEFRDVSTPRRSMDRGGSSFPHLPNFDLSPGEMTLPARDAQRRSSQGDSSTDASPSVPLRNPDVLSFPHLSNDSIGSSSEIAMKSELGDLEQGYASLRNRFTEFRNRFDALSRDGLLSIDIDPLRESPLSPEQKGQLVELHEQTGKFDEQYSEIMAEAGHILSENHFWVQEERKVAQSMRQAHADSSYNNPLYSPSGLLETQRTDLSYQMEALTLLKGKCEALTQGAPTNELPQGRESSNRERLSAAIGRINEVLKQGNALKERHEGVRAISYREIEKSKLQKIMPILDVYKECSQLHIEAEELSKRALPLAVKSLFNPAVHDRYYAFTEELNGLSAAISEAEGNKAFDPFLYSAATMDGEEKWHKIESSQPRDQEQVWQSYEKRYDTTITYNSDSGGYCIEARVKGSNDICYRNTLFPVRGEFQGQSNYRYPKDTNVEYEGTTPLRFYEVISSQMRYYNEHRAEHMQPGNDKSALPFNLYKYTGSTIVNDQTLRRIAVIKSRDTGPKGQYEYPEGSRGYYAIVTAETAKSKFWLARQQRLRCSKVELPEGKEDETIFYFTRSSPLPLD